MPEFVTRMTSSTFTMRLPIDEKIAVQVTVTGKGLVFDRDSGAILKGTIDTVALSTLSVSGRNVTVIETQTIGGLKMPADKLAEICGDKFWNHIKYMVESFDKLSQLHDGIFRSYISPEKSVFHGSELADTMAGTKQNDVMFGEAGNDRLNGGAGHDHIDGGKGNDNLSGGNGNDFLIDRYGNNTFSGGAGNDVMQGGSGADRMSGSTGRDVLYGASGTNRLSGGRDSDAFVFNTRDVSRTTITDFDRSDLLVNLATGSAVHGYKNFVEHARQVGRDVVFVLDDFQLTLKNVRLGEIGAEQFGSSEIAKDAGLLF